MEVKQFELSNRLFLISAVLIGMIAISILAGVIVSFKTVNGDYPRDITVSGEGKVYVTPDVATIDITVSNEGNENTDIPTMIEKNTSKMNAIIDGIKNLGVDEKDIKTTNYNLSSQYNWTEDQGSYFKGYRITNTILVKVRDFNKIGDVLTTANNNGATAIGNISFAIEDPEKATQEAREKAIAQAKEKAKSIAKASGLRLGRILSVQDSYSNGIYPTYSKELGGMGSSDASVPPVIQSGQNEVSVTVSLTYRVK